MYKLFIKGMLSEETCKMPGGGTQDKERKEIKQGCSLYCVFSVGQYHPEGSKNWLLGLQ